MTEQQQNQLRKAHEIAKLHGGECLSLEYLNTDSYLVWKCANTEHASWRAKFRKVVGGGQWCPKCAGKHSKEENLNLAKEYAKSKGGECLSVVFENVDAKLVWKCDNPAHPTWEASYWSVVQRKNKSWCPRCAGFFSKEVFLERAKNLAIKRGGECLSEEFKNQSEKLLWKCSNQNHETWLATYSNVVHLNRWCPQCADFYVKEHKIRAILEYILDEKFPKQKLSWNKNPKTGSRLELDGYNAQLKLAFEFQGDQHYKPKHFGNSDEDLEEIKFRDEAKKLNCIQNDVRLLIFDDTANLNSPQDMLGVVLDTFKKEGVVFKKNIDLDVISKIFYTSNDFQKEQLFKAKKYAESRGGQCLSEVYVDNLLPMKWACNNEGHDVWESPFANIVSSQTWCPQCANKFSPEIFLDRARKYAESRGGQCLSEKYKNNTIPMLWKCGSVEHDAWEAPFANVVSSKTWCPQCSGRFPADKKLLIAKEYAKSKGGECLSDTYRGVKGKLLWHCGNSSHIAWESSYDSVVNHGSWCPNCAGFFTLEEMLFLAQSLAKNKGGECLSREYINSVTKMHWKCALGHEWFTKLGHVKDGSWCPKCANRKIV